MATTPRGFRDILPDEAEMREHIVATVKARLVHHGYRPIETPLIESASVGEANAWSSDAPFNLFDDNGALLAVRPDNTTSVVRAIAARMSERDLPLRLRYEAPVVRQQPRGTARARQFTQLGYELVGEGGDAADAEMTLIAAEALDDLGLNSWQLVCGSVVPYQALLDPPGEGIHGRPGHSREIGLLMNINDLQFDDRGLITCVVQQHDTGEVLMVA